MSGNSAIAGPKNLTLNSGRGGKGYDWASIYLDALRDSGTGDKQAAADAAQVSLVTVWRKRSEDDEFRVREAAIIKTMLDKLEGKMLKRALDGDEAVVMSPQGAVHTYQKYDTKIQIHMARRLETGSHIERTQTEVGAVGSFATAAVRAEALADIEAEVEEIDAGAIGDGLPEEKKD